MRSDIGGIVIIFFERQEVAAATFVWVIALFTAFGVLFLFAEGYESLSSRSRSSLGKAFSGIVLFALSAVAVFSCIFFIDKVPSNYVLGLVVGLLVATSVLVRQVWKLLTIRSSEVKRQRISNVTGLGLGMFICAWVLPVIQSFFLNPELWQQILLIISAAIITLLGLKIATGAWQNLKAREVDPSVRLKLFEDGSKSFLLAFVGFAIGLVGLGVNLLQRSAIEGWLHGIIYWGIWVIAAALILMGLAASSEEETTKN